ncbi:P-loop containing nucleoside triphosphate hydrolase protein [Mycena alexandri]|uniref:RNA helicase n=1 Tax=Mycena alexandri TaxID=1745969 RepID=A0AAD6T5W1_9AGAR|nr:P-loop containing nucleoside triphosphate hydrolase protein [Mycena alexandri]
MPPRKGIVKSGNAGNSSKDSKPDPKAQKTDLKAPEVVEALFPAGFKYPLTLLNERCQKNGWEKPIIDTRRQQGGYAFTVTISKLNKKSGQKETTRMEPHPAYICPSAIEARHWGATYALYRFCNGIQLNRVLPPGPRQYWDILAAEHNNCPEHQKWMYNADPFAARKEVDQRQAQAMSKKRDESTPAGGSVEPLRSSEPRHTAAASGEFAQAPEVKMAGALRDLAEDAIKQAISLYPEAADVAPAVLSDEDAPKVNKQLETLGFTPAQARNAVVFLSHPSPVTANLMSTLSPLEAAIEYLILHVPECDLPQRFMPSANTSNSFVVSTHAGADDLKRRWIEDKTAKEAGWPIRVVQTCVDADPSLVENWDLLIVTLGRKLTGIEDPAVPAGAEPYQIDPDEIDALGASMEDSTQLVMPLFSAPVNLHVFVSAEKGFPRPGYAPMFLTSTAVPAYVRLHLISQLLIEMEGENFIEEGEGFLIAAMRVLEATWAAIEDDGPPDMSVVLRHIVPRVETEGVDYDDTPLRTVGNSRTRKKGGGNYRRDERTSAQIKEEFERLCRDIKYKEMLSNREKLPAFSAKDEFLSLLQKSRVVVVVGETGCGKTTQLPQFILDSLITSNQGSTASIIVTQPRRLSAISVAARVSAERIEDGSVGYAIRGESKQSKNTKLLFCTTGVVLRRLGSGDTLQHVSHVVVDEVHERSVDGDFLLLELRELLKKHPTLKVILMSATINHETFINYFGGAPLLTIPGFTHPVTDIYLEDIIPMIKYRASASRSTAGRKESGDALQAFRDEHKSKGLDDAAISTIQIISRSDRLDFRLIAEVVRHIIADPKNKRGGILIFLPGVPEIRQCMDAMRTALPGGQADVFPLHANLSSDEQRRVFMRTSKWKVIAATNVAETSITIDDVIYVVDAGKVKETQYDPETSMSRLVEAYVTRAAARQRRGRAGRTQPGFCYKLYTRKQEINMGKYPVPEILRVPLESISLTVKVMREEEDVKLFLNRAIDPPKVAAMEAAWTVLEELGAVDLNGKLTPLGRHISTLPVDLRLAKMLVLGTIFQCLGPVLTIAAALSSKPLFLTPMDKRDEASQARARFATAGSDLLTDLAAYDACNKMRSEGQSHGAVRTFCEENFISPNTIRDITTLRNDFISSLSDLGFIPLASTPSTPALNTNSANTNLIKAVVLGGLWPRVARVHLPKSAIKFDRVSAGTVQRENIAKEFKMFDLREGRVFLHPQSILFEAAAWKSPFLVYFHKHMTSKVFLRDATEIPLYALLLFGGPVAVNHVAGGLTIGTKDSWIRLKAWPRIGVLVNQLRRLLDAQLQRCVEEGAMLNTSGENPVVRAMLALLTNDGLTE